MPILKQHIIYCHIFSTQNFKRYFENSRCGPLRLDTQNRAFNPWRTPLSFLYVSSPRNTMTADSMICMLHQLRKITENHGPTAYINQTYGSFSWVRAGWTNWHMPILVFFVVLTSAFLITSSSRFEHLASVITRLTRIWQSLPTLKDTPWFNKIWWFHPGSPSGDRMICTGSSSHGERPLRI